MIWQDKTYSMALKEYKKNKTKKKIDKTHTAHMWVFVVARATQVHNGSRSVLRQDPSFRQCECLRGRHLLNETASLLHLCRAFYEIRQVWYETRVNWGHSTQAHTLIHSRMHLHTYRFLYPSTPRFLFLADMSEIWCSSTVVNPVWHVLRCFFCLPWW